MNAHSERRRLWPWALLGVLVLAAVIVALLHARTPRGPRLLNEATPAREARPLSPEPDPRFAPLPIEPEKHGK